MTYERRLSLAAGEQQAGRGAALRLLAATHWRIDSRFAPHRDGMLQRLDLLADYVGLQARSVLDRFGNPECDHLLCSTHLSNALSNVPSRTGQLFDGIAVRTGRRPQGLLHAYECAGWGFALRFMARYTDQPLLLLSIVDVDLHHMSWYEYHPSIGHSGFGMTTLLLALPADWDQVGQAKGPYADSGFREFIRAVRARRRPDASLPSFIPFLRDDLRAIAERLLGADTIPANRLADYGHCFGSDPWISLIEWFRQSPQSEPQTVPVGAFAYNGYYSLCDVEVTPDSWLEFERFSGDRAGLEALVAHAQQGRPIASSRADAGARQAGGYAQ